MNKQLEINLPLSKSKSFVGIVFFFGGGVKEALIQTSLKLRKSSSDSGHRIQQEHKSDMHCEIQIFFSFSIKLNLPISGSKRTSPGMPSRKRK